MSYYYYYRLAVAVLFFDSRHALRDVAPTHCRSPLDEPTVSSARTFQ